MEARAFLDGAVPPQTTLPAPVNPPHRPNGYTLELARRICDLIAEGKTLKQICTGQDGLPASKSTVFRWLLDEPDFRKLYEVALRWRTEGLAEDIIEIADDGTNDWRLEDQDDGMPVVALNKEALARSGLRIQARQWLLSKQLPQRYGAKPEEMPLPAPTGEDAKPVNPQGQVQPKVIEADPLYGQVIAWEKAADVEAERVKQP